MKRFLIIIMLLMGGFAVSNSVYAASKIEVPNWAKQGQSAKADVSSLTEDIALIMYIFAGGIAVLGGTSGGLLIMDDQSEAGWKRIKNIVIGAGVILCIGLFAQAL